MVRMLFLRDIDTDVDIRCRNCGHGGVLPRAMLVRRFGPSYPVLSIAPHYRCSRCDSRDTECRPAPPPEPEAPFEAGAPADDGMAAFNATIAALRGMVDAAHDSRTGPAAAADEDPDDTVIRPSAAHRALWDELADPSPRPVEADPDDGWSRPPDAHDEPEAAEPPEEPEPALSGFPPEFAALFERAYADDPEEEPPPPPRDRPVFTAGWDEDEADMDDRDRLADPDDPAHDAMADIMADTGEEPEPSNADILSFAIRDRDDDEAPRNRRSAAAAPDDDSDATLSMQKTLAALRGMIENAAAEPGDLPPPAKGPAAKPPSPQPPARPAAGTGAASLDDTLAKLRGLLDLDAPGADGAGQGDRPPGGRRR